jgi:hypothetical protein
VGANSTQGAAYVFVRSGTTWTLQARLVASDGAANDAFGGHVAISGDFVLVGAPSADISSRINQGAVYAFSRTGTTWTQQSKLIALDGAASDTFGRSVALDGITALIGAATNGPTGTSTNHITGAVYHFERSGTTWTQFAKLNAPQLDSNFGCAVSISGNSALIGARSEDAGPNTSQGAAYVYQRTSRANWVQQARLTASDGAPSDEFGGSVSISADTAVVGASRNTSSISFEGSAYVFGRLGSVWGQKAKLNGATSIFANFGDSVAVSGNTTIVGAPNDNGLSTGAGSASIYDGIAADLGLVTNPAASTGFGTLPAAVAASQSGNELRLNGAAWRSIGSLNTLGRSLAFSSTQDARTPAGSVLSLGGSSVLSVPAGTDVQIFGELRAQGFIDVVADRFELGVRGILTARTGSSVDVAAPTSRLLGQIRVEQNALLRFDGNVDVFGPTTGFSGGVFESSQTITNNDAWTMTASQINAPLFVNNLRLTNFGSTAIFGSFTNSVGATAEIRGGTLFVFGDLTNNGTVIGTICSTCSGLPPGMDVGGSLSLGNAANLTMPFNGSIVHVGGSFDCAIDDHVRFDLSQATLQLESYRPEVTLEVMSADIGVDPLGLDRSIAGHFPIGELHIGGFPTTVRLVDAYDNALDGQAACEALYIDTLRIDPGSRLINLTCRIYYNTLVNNGVVDAPENLIPLQGVPCPADFNQDGGVDGADVVAFFAAWENGESIADVNLDGGVDGGDIDVFFAAWEAGGC